MNTQRDIGWCSRIALNNFFRVLPLHIRFPFKIVADQNGIRLEPFVSFLPAIIVNYADVVSYGDYAPRGVVKLAHFFIRPFTITRQRKGTMSDVALYILNPEVREKLLLVFKEYIPKKGSAMPLIEITKPSILARTILYFCLVLLISLFIVEYL